VCVHIFLRISRWLLFGLLALTLLNSGVSVVFSYLGKDFWNALSAKDVTQFGMVLQQYVVALIAGAPVVTMYAYQRKQLSVHWREWMTFRTIDLYTNNRVYYNIERSTIIDNPDQRITEDVNRYVPKQNVSTVR
jgi:vitamin B12/bleomycin/antimicrobial peptide transport system ATP-binding/permease protein